VSVEPLRRPDGSGCPGCGRALASVVPTSVCGRCGSGVVHEAGRSFEILRFASNTDAVDVPRRLAAALERHGAAGAVDLLEVHRLSLPYWWCEDGLEAAFPTTIDATRRLPVPDGEIAPAALRTPPPIPSSEIDGDPLRLVLMPAYDVVFGRRGVKFHAVLEAIDGCVYADLWPHGARAPIDRRMAAVLAFDAAVFVLAGYLSPDNLVRGVVFVAISYPIFLLTRAAVRATDR